MLIDSWEFPLHQVAILLCKSPPQVHSFLSLLPTSTHLLTCSHMVPSPLTPIPPTRCLFYPLPREIHVFPIPFLHTVFLLILYAHAWLFLESKISDEDTERNATESKVKYFIFIFLSVPLIIYSCTLYQEWSILVCLHI